MNKTTIIWKEGSLKLAVCFYVCTPINVQQKRFTTYKKKKYNTDIEDTTYEKNQSKRKQVTYQMAVGLRLKGKMYAIKSSIFARKSSTFGSKTDGQYPSWQSFLKPSLSFTQTIMHSKFLTAPLLSSGPFPLTFNPLLLPFVSLLLLILQ